uniref:Ribosomal protein S2 n=1 Tax=Prototheca wickerhamii TaxID=3111 RepID=O99011_PROWI|nr:ribosomal protein S2 [Prototheca wickerhamii]CAB38449.1 30S ribosomal protein S2 [Prototheca wickerhamii]
MSQNIKKIIKLEDMVQSGMHFGHFTSEWNPRMQPFIYGKRHGRHILDLVQTYYLLNNLLAFLEKSAMQGKKFLFVGTKKQIAPLIAKTAISCNSYYVNQRWLGGMLTNWKTIQNSLYQLQEFRKAEQLGEWNLLKKKEIAQKKRQKLRLDKNLSGLENMKSLPDIVIIIGQAEELNAVKECRQLGITTVTLLDSNCDPFLADWYIPANDDSVAAVQYLLSNFKEAIISGQKTNNANQSLVNAKSNIKKLGRAKAKKT